MKLLNKLPGHRRAAPGLEWAIWKRLPAALLWGTLLPLALGAGLWLAAPAAPSPAQERDLLLLGYQLAGLVMLEWTLIFTLAIGCVVVMVMKGPAYVADAYPPPGRDDLR